MGANSVSGKKHYDDNSDESDKSSSSKSERNDEYFVTTEQTPRASPFGENNQESEQGGKRGRVL